MPQGTGSGAWKAWAPTPCYCALKLWPCPCRLRGSAKSRNNSMRMLDQRAAFAEWVEAQEGCLVPKPSSIHMQIGVSACACPLAPHARTCTHAHARPYTRGGGWKVKVPEEKMCLFLETSPGVVRYGGRSRRVKGKLETLEAFRSDWRVVAFNFLLSDVACFPN